MGSARRCWSGRVAPGPDVAHRVTVGTDGPPGWPGRHPDADPVEAAGHPLPFIESCCRTTVERVQGRPVGDRRVGDRGSARGPAGAPARGHGAGRGRDGRVIPTRRSRLRYVDPPPTTELAGRRRGIHVPAMSAHRTVRRNCSRSVLRNTGHVSPDRPTLCFRPLFTERPSRLPSAGRVPASRSTTVPVREPRAAGGRCSRFCHGGRRGGSG